MFHLDLYMYHEVYSVTDISKKSVQRICLHIISCTEIKSSIDKQKALESKQFKIKNQKQSF